MQVISYSCRPTRVLKRYDTTFSLTENPISEGGRWVSAAQMSPRTNVRTTAGIGAYGTAPGFTGPDYQDSGAHLNLGFGPNQEASAVIRSTASSNLELELFTRAVFTPAYTRAYEFDYYANTGIISLVRWDGTAASPNVFTFLRDGSGHEGEAPGNTGDIVRVRAYGNVQSCWYTPISTGIEALLFAYDTTSDTIRYDVGDLGIGMFTNPGGTPNSGLAWSEFHARELA